MPDKKPPIDIGGNRNKKAPGEAGAFRDSVAGQRELPRTSWPGRAPVSTPLLNVVTPPTSVAT
jgi:hypothetical protein